MHWAAVSPCPCSPNTAGGQDTCFSLLKLEPHSVLRTFFTVKIRNFTSFIWTQTHQQLFFSFSFFFTLIFLCRPLTEEEIIDLRERHYDSIAEKQKELDMKIQKEVSSLLCCVRACHRASVRRGTWS